MYAQDAYHALSTEASLCIIPKENSIFGSVIETYDLLRNSEAGVERFICGEAILQVQHCLIAKKGTRLEDVKHIFSHEQVYQATRMESLAERFSQALGQCAEFCTHRLPEATTVKVNSTAAAARLVAEGGMVDSAAICSSVCATVYDGLEVLARSIQTEDCT